MMSMVTPPVCFAAFAAASLAQAPMMATGVAAFRLALAGQLIPFLFAFNPGLLLIGGPVDIVLDTLRALVCIGAAGMAFEIFRIGPASADSHAPAAVLYLRRLLLGLGGACLIYHEPTPTIIGLALVAAGGAVAFHVSRSSAQTQTA
ncbi:MAG: hypothetical protein KDJ29_18825, partial [Hyphomicrobiales bacterium]|nr:hypothetical protein [Hyphomicrobiales bacterium]